MRLKRYMRTSLDVAEFVERLRGTYADAWFMYVDEMGLWNKGCLRERIRNYNDYKKLIHLDTYKRYKDVFVRVYVSDDICQICMQYVDREPGNSTEYYDTLLMEYDFKAGSADYVSVNHGKVVWAGRVTLDGAAELLLGWCYFTFTICKSYTKGKELETIKADGGALVVLLDYVDAGFVNGCFVVKDVGEQVYIKDTDFMLTDDGLIIKKYASDYEIRGGYDLDWR